LVDEAAPGCANAVSLGSLTRLFHLRSVANHRQVHVGTQPCNGRHQIGGALDRRELPCKCDQEFAFAGSQPPSHERARLPLRGSR